MVDVYACYVQGGFSALLGLLLTGVIFRGVELEPDLRRSLRVYRLGFAALAPMAVLGWVPIDARSALVARLLPLGAGGAACLSWGLRLLYGADRGAATESAVVVGVGVAFGLASLAPPAGAAVVVNALFAVIGAWLFHEMARMHRASRRAPSATEWGQLLVLAIFTSLFVVGAVHAARHPAAPDRALGLSLPAFMMPFGSAVLGLMPLAVAAIGCGVINERLARRLRDLALSDELTGLPSRRGMNEMAPLVLGEHRRRGRRTALLMFDLDHFKRINDVHGHPVGDQVLRQVSRALRQHLRADALMARLGGEEFAALVPVADAAEAQAAAERLREVAARTPSQTEAGPLTVTVSIGVALMSSDDLPRAIKAADDALYAAKHAGRDRVSLAEVV